MAETESRAKRVLIAGMLWIIILGILGSIGYFLIYKRYWKKIQAATGTQSKYSDSVTIRQDEFSGYCILRSPEFSNLCKQEGIKPEIEDDKADYLDRLKALKDKKADMAVFTVDSFITAVSALKMTPEDCPVTAILVIDETRGADAALAYKTAVKSFDDMNKMNACFVATPNSPSEFFARLAKAEFQLARMPEKWMVEADGAADVLAKLKASSRTEPKVFVLWEPYVSRALKDPEVKVLLSTEALKGIIVDVLVVRRELLAEKPSLVKSVVQAYLRAAYSYKQEMTQLVLDDAKTGELTKEDAGNIVRGIHWKNTLENYAHFRLLNSQETKGVDDMEDIFDRIGYVLYKTGAVKKEFTETSDKKSRLTALFTNKVLAELQASSFHPGSTLGLIKNPNPEKIKEDVQLVQLTEQEWDELIPIGSMQAENIYFRAGSSDLGIQAKRDLEELAASLKSMPNYYVKVLGHARADGDVDANMELAKERATVTAEYLAVRMGISRIRIKAIAVRPTVEGGEAQSVTFLLGMKSY